MFRFLIRVWQWIKSWFGRKKPQVVAVPQPTAPKPELSDLEYENLLAELLEEVVRGSSWGQIQGFLFANNLEPEKFASWLSRFGQQCLLQPESHHELGRKLLLLSKIAKGELREVTRELGKSLSSVETEEKAVKNSEAIKNKVSSTSSVSEPEILQTSVETLETQNKKKYYNEQYFINRSRKLCELERYEEALASCDQVLKLKPDSEIAGVIRSHVIYELGRKEEAVASFDEVIKRKPDFEIAWSNRGTVVYDSPNYDSYIQKKFVSLFCSKVSEFAQKAVFGFGESNSSQAIDKLETSLENSRLLIIKAFENSGSTKLIERINQAPSEELYQLIQQAIPQKLIDLIQQTVSEKVVIQLEKDLLSHPHHFNHQLNLRGYEGQIVSLEAELDRSIQKNTHPLGWGKLNYYVGKVHYNEGSLHCNSFDYWHKAAASHNQALKTLTEADYPKEHLEVLQELIKVQLGFGNTEAANQLRLKGLEVLKNLLNQTPSFVIKKQLQLKFTHGVTTD